MTLPTHNMPAGHMNHGHMPVCGPCTTPPASHTGHGRGQEGRHAHLCPPTVLPVVTTWPHPVSPTMPHVLPTELMCPTHQPMCLAHRCISHAHPHMFPTPHASTQASCMPTQASFPPQQLLPPADAACPSLMHCPHPLT